MTLCRLTFGGYDPLTPTAAGAVSVSQRCPVSAVVLPASQGTISNFDNQILKDPERLRSFRYLILAAKGLTFEPKANDVLRCFEGLYRLLGATPLNPAGDGAIIFSVGATLDNVISIAAIDA